MIGRNAANPPTGRDREPRWCAGKVTLFRLQRAGIVAVVRLAEPRLALADSFSDKSLLGALLPRFLRTALRSFPYNRTGNLKSHSLSHLFAASMVQPDELLTSPVADDMGARPVLGLLGGGE